jgi:thiol-disulfide isomerase/thioredoxin/Tfp pilus assembly protein PilF
MDIGKRWLFGLAVVAVAASASAATLRDSYRSMDFHTGARDGAAAVLANPQSTELRAWYIANLSRVDAEAAMRAARMLRYAHPDDAWSWFAMTAAQLRSDDEHEQAPDSAEKMIALYKGDDVEVPRMYATALRELARYEKLDSFLAGKTSTWARAEAAMALDGRAWSDSKLVDAAYAAYRDAEAADPQDVRLVYAHAASLSARRRAAEAAPLWKRAIELSPDSIVIRTSYWHALGKSEKAAVEEDVAAFLARHHDDPATLSAANRAYHAVGDAANEEATRKRLTSEFPATNEAQAAMYSYAVDYFVANMAHGDKDSAVRAEAMKRLREFIDYPYQPDRVWLAGAYGILFRLTRDDAPIGEFLQVVDGLLAYGDCAEWDFNVAEALATRGVRLDQAETLARQGLRDARVLLDRDRSSYTEEEFAKAVNYRTAMAQAALGWVLLERGKLAAAGIHLKEAVRLYPDNAGARHHLGKWYEAMGQNAKAEEQYAAGLAKERAPKTENLDALRALYQRRHHTNEGWDAYAVAIREGSASKEKRNILASRLAPARRVKEGFALKDLEGQTVSLASLKGKVAVVKFWGTWCAPCVAEMPELQKVVDRYANDPNVAIVTITSDHDPALPREFMKKNNYRFPVLLDDGWITRSTNVHAYPTTWFLTPEGRIAFEKRGISAHMADEFAWRIEALRPKP